MRRRRPEKREILPDPVYNDLVVTKFVNNLMTSGKKSISEKIFYKSLEIAAIKSKEDDGLAIFKKALTMRALLAAQRTGRHPFPPRKRNPAPGAPLLPARRRHRKGPRFSWGRREHGRARAPADWQRQRMFLSVSVV